MAEEKSGGSNRREQLRTMGQITERSQRILADFARAGNDDHTGLS